MKIAQVKVRSMADIVKLTRDEAAQVCADAAESGRKLYVIAAKARIHVESLLGDDETVYGVLRASGLTNSQINNGTPLVQVWKTLVEPGHMSEAQFDSINFTQAKAAAKLAGKKLALLQKHIDSPEDWESLEEHGMTVAEKAEADAEAQARAAAAKATKAEAQPAASTETETTVEPSTETTETEETDTSEEESESEPESEETETAPQQPAVSTKPAKGRDRLAEFRQMMRAAEELALEVATEDPSLMASVWDEVVKTSKAITDTFAEVDHDVTAPSEKAA